MSRRKLSPEKKAIISELIEMYGIESISDIQEALKDLLGGTIQGMLESELDMELGYEKHEKTKEPKSNYRNGYKPKTLKATLGEIEIDDRMTEILNLNPK